MNDRFIELVKAKFPIKQDLRLTKLVNQEENLQNLTVNRKTEHLILVNHQHNTHSRERNNDGSAKAKNEWFEPKGFELLKSLKVLEINGKIDKFGLKFIINNILSSNKKVFRKLVIDTTSLL